ncbi:MAG TPA: NACHT domain-containing protein [Vicinamibacterales bacterium]|jgi:DNA polymerase III delta prime subunit
MSITETIAAAVTKAVVERVLRLGASGASSKAKVRTESAIKEHLREVANWTSKVHTLDAACPRDLKTSTIPLALDSEPRRVRTTTPQTLRKEDDLLTDDSNYLILGNPGSGKTTTIKRVARRLLLEAPQRGDSYQFPIIVRLRELVDGLTVNMVVAKVFGLKYETVEIRNRVGGLTTTRYETRVGDDPIESVIGRLLSDLGAVVLLDGLDEVWSEARSDIAREISQLARTTSGSKFIVSSRTGDYTLGLENFVALQLCPLRPEQVKEIARRWLKDPTSFITALETLPYRDIADRPLLLTQLLILYSRFGFLPEQPAHVYKRVIRILLEEWDEQRNIQRKSKYAGFDTDRKAEFLAAIAFHITYTYGRSQFDEDELVSAYRRVHQVFNLPLAEARQVARELETHTGIICEVGSRTYEFSHLSIQEYLAASFIVRDGSLVLVRRALAGQPAPVAIAVALSSQPSHWLARLILNQEFQLWRQQSARGFLTRVLIERPFFEVFEPLGWSVLYLCSRLSKVDGAVPEVLVQIAQLPSVMQSIAEALRWYAVTEGTEANQSGVVIRRRDGLESSYDMVQPPDGLLPTVVLRQIAAKWPDAEVWRSVSGKEHRSSVRCLMI